MATLLVIALASAVYFAVQAHALRGFGAEDAGQLLIEVEPDEHGYHAYVVDLGIDAVLHVTDSFSTEENAIRAACAWVKKNG